MDFGAGADTFEVRASSATKGGLIELHLDDFDGKLLGVCRVEGTGSWETWTNLKIAIPPTRERTRCA